MVQMLQCSFKDHSGAMGFPMEKEFFESLLIDAKKQIILLKKKSNFKEITDNMYNEMKQRLDPLNQEYSKKHYTRGELNEDYCNIIFKFIMLFELNNTDVQLGFCDDMDDFIQCLETTSTICKIEGCNKKGIKRCSGCGWARYCSRECQKNDWKNHKSNCCKKGKPNNA
jgi:hypothetical protein